MFVGVAALWTVRCRLEGVPRMAAASAEPPGTIARFPRAFRAVDFDFAFGTHVGLDVVGRGSVRILENALTEIGSPASRILDVGDAGTAKAARCPEAPDRSRE